MNFDKIMKKKKNYIPEKSYNTPNFISHGYFKFTSLNVKL